MKYFILLLLTLPCHAGYFTDHVKESILINRDRKIIYSQMTAGKSDQAIKKLISVERMMLPFSMVYDHRASWFQKRGVPVFKDEFVPMIALPEYDTNAPAPASEIESVPWKAYREELRILIKRKDREKLLSRSLEIIHQMETQKEYWCLTRHLVESVYRIAWFLPKRIEEARLKNIKSPENLIWDVIEFHLIGFRLFASIDLKAAPIQKSGVPMICSELPNLLIDL